MSIKGFFKLTAVKNVLAQVALIGLQVAASEVDGLNGWQKLAAHGAIGAVQGAISKKAQYTNPDGTPATEPYTPKPKTNKKRK